MTRANGSTIEFGSLTLVVFSVSLACSSSPLLSGGGSSVDPEAPVQEHEAVQRDAAAAAAAREATRGGEQCATRARHHRIRPSEVTHRTRKEGSGKKGMRSHPHLTHLCVPSLSAFQTGSRLADAQLRSVCRLVQGECGDHAAAPHRPSHPIESAECSRTRDITARGRTRRDQQDSELDGSATHAAAHRAAGERERVRTQESCERKAQRDIASG